jgi:ParB-like chromosome segregation protein Spo0J
MKDVHKVSKKETHWPADHVERRSVESLIPYARNARTHSDEQVAQIAASIKEWGWTTPVLVDETGQIIAGHGRVMAARKLGIEEIPVMVASGWSEAQRRAYVLADNKIALNSGWDMDLLKVELQDIGEMSFDLDKIGFSVGEMSSLFDEPNFDPGSEDDQGKLDELSPKMVQCPHCGDEFDLRKHGEG